MPLHHPVRYVDRRVGDKPGQRSAAGAALAAGLAGIVSLLWFAVGSPLEMLALVLGALAVLFLGFAALTTRGPRRLAAASLTLVVGLAVIAGTVAKSLGDDGVRWSGAAGLGALVLAVVLARYALRVPPPRPRDVWAVPSTGPTTRRGVLLANPASGGGRFEEFALGDVARRHGIEVVVLSDGDDLAALATAAARRGADALGMAGGDGSLATVARVCVEHDLAFVCVPAGTRNHFAADLGLDRADPTTALAAFVNGDEYRLDYAMVNGRMFLNNVSLGVYAAAVGQPGYRDAPLGTALEQLPSIVAEGGPCFDLCFDVPQAGRWDTAALVQVSNGVYEMGAAGFGRRLRLDAGELGVVAVDVHHVTDLVAITVLAAARQAERAAGLWAWSTPSFEVTSPHPTMAAGVDGEHAELDTPISFRTVPRGLRVLVPSGSAVGLDAQHLGARGAVGGLVEVAFNLGGGPTGP